MAQHARPEGAAVLPEHAGRAPGKSRASFGIHTIYLAIITVLIIIIVYAGALAIRARRMAQRVKEHFGIQNDNLIKRVAPRPGALREGAETDLIHPRTYDEYQADVDDLVSRALALEEFGPTNKLSQACAHALSNGKRLRAIIVLEIVRSLNERREALDSANELVTAIDGAEAALLIEYLHTASLVIDDMPTFDNDAERRGVQAVHTMSSPAIAQMAAISLVSAAFQSACRQIEWIRDNCPEFRNPDHIGMVLAGEISRAIGIFGAAGGQYMDSAPPEELYREFGENALVDIMQRKTASFFEIAFAAGWLIGRGDPAQLADAKEAGRRFGVAFQIADDIGDQEQDKVRRSAGKPGWNFANATSESFAQQEVSRNLEACSLLLHQLGLRDNIWQEIFKKLQDMCNPKGGQVRPARADPSGSSPAPSGLI